MLETPSDLDDEPNAVHPRRGPGSTRFLAVTLACLVVVAVNALVAANQLALPMPATPWEAGVAVEGWRFSQGQPTYGDVDREIFAGHMYGPLCSGPSSPSRGSATRRRAYPP